MFYFKGATTQITNFSRAISILCNFSSTSKSSALIVHIQRHIAFNLKMRFLSYSSLIATLITSNILQEVSAQTPPDFQPVTLNHLRVSYTAVVISPAGITVPSDGEPSHESCLLSMLMKFEQR